MSLKNIKKTTNVIELPPELEKVEIDPSLIKDIEMLCSYYTFDKVDATYAEVSKQVTRILNKDYSKVMIGGKSRLMELRDQEPVYSDWREVFSHNEDLSINYQVETPAGNPKSKTIGVFELFRKSNKARKFDYVLFDPSRAGDYGRTKNLYKGFDFERNPNKFELTDKNALFNAIPSAHEGAYRFFEHLLNNICDGDESAFLQFIAWLSDMVNAPHLKPSIAVVMRGSEKGTGKSIVSLMMQSILKNMAFSSSEVDHVFGKFNGHLQNKILVVGEEMSWGGDKRIASKMKDHITSPTLTIEKKYLDATEADKYYRLMLIDNGDWVVNASRDERRWLVLEVNPQQAQNDAYFEPLMRNKKIKKSASNEVFYLLSAVTHSIKMTRATETKGLNNQKIISMGSIDQWWQEVLDPESEVTINGISNYNDWDNERIPRQTFLNAYLNWFDAVKPKSNDRESSSRVFGRKLINCVSGGDKKILHNNTRGYSINKALAQLLSSKLYGSEY